MTLIELITTIMLICGPNSEISDQCTINKTNDVMEVYLCGDEFTFGTVGIGLMDLNDPSITNTFILTSDCGES